jgi:hypothetical protein
MKTIHSISLAAVLAVASTVGCSSTPAPTGNGTESSSGAGFGSSTNGGSASGGNASSGIGSSTGGSSTGTASGGASSGSIPSSGSGGSSGADAGGSTSGGATDGGAAAPMRGCGQATSCTPGSDLAPPAAADGFQIVTPDQGLAILPGEEAYYCYYKAIPGNASINVGAFQSWMTSGASHHFILFTGTGGADGTVAGGVVSGGGTGCVPQGTWVYATSTPGQIIELKMPDGVGLPMPANQTLIFNVHVINTGSATLYPKIKLNVLYAKNATASAGAVVSFNSGIAVGAGQTQDVKGYCSNLPAGSKFFAYTTHVHRHGGSVASGAYTDVNFVSGGKTTNIVHSTDWENPDVALWGPPNYLTVNPSDQFTYDCHYVNQDATAVTFGETAASGEMCMSIGYYFPVGIPTTGVSNPTYCH